MERAALLLLASCASAESLVRKQAAKDFECPPEQISVERRFGTFDGGDGYPRYSRAFIARGCELTVVYGVGGEWGTAWASTCAPVTVRGKQLQPDPFASATAAFMCLDTIADAGAVAPRDDAPLGQAP